jgi:hypothetical protein
VGAGGAHGDFADLVVAGFGHVDKGASRVDRNARGTAKERGGPEAVDGARDAAACEGGHDEGGGDHAHAAISKVSNVDDARRVDSDALRLIKLSIRANRIYIAQYAARNGANHEV